MNDRDNYYNSLYIAHDESCAVAFDFVKIFPSIVQQALILHNIPATRENFELAYDAINPSRDAAFKALDPFIAQHSLDDIRGNVSLEDAVLPGFFDAVRGYKQRNDEPADEVTDDELAGVMRRLRPALNTKPVWHAVAEVLRNHAAFAHIKDSEYDRHIIAHAKELVTQLIGYQIRTLPEAIRTERFWATKPHEDLYGHYQKRGIQIAQMMGFITPSGAPPSVESELGL